MRIKNNMEWGINNDTEGSANVCNGIEMCTLQII